MAGMNGGSEELGHLLRQKVQGMRALRQPAYFWWVRPRISLRFSRDALLSSYGGGELKAGDSCSQALREPINRR